MRTRVVLVVVAMVAVVVLYPTAVEGVEAFVTRYVEGRAEARPEHAGGVSEAVAQNGTETVPLESAPYIPAPEPGPRFYLGFDPDGFDQVAGEKLNIYIAFENQDPSALPGGAGASDPGEALSFEGWTGISWQAITATRPDGAAAGEGIVTLEMPAGLAPAERFGQAAPQPASLRAGSAVARLGHFPQCRAGLQRGGLAPERARLEHRRARSEL